MSEEKELRDTLRGELYKSIGMLNHDLSAAADCGYFIELRIVDITQKEDKAPRTHIEWKMWQKV